MSLEKKKQKKLQRKSKRNVASQSRDRKQVRTLGLVVALLGGILYINTMNHGYVLDDFSVIKENWVVQRGFSGIPIILKTSYRYGYWNSQGSLYRPLSLIMFAIEWDLAVGDDSVNDESYAAAAGFSHIVNILLYALLGLILFQVLRRVLSRYNVLIPLIASLLFIAHPIHTEVVANIKSRDEILSMLFALLTIHFIWKWLQNSSIKTLTIALVCFFLGLISKEGIATFLFVIPLMAWFFADQTPKQAAKILGFLAVPLVLYVMIRQGVLGDAVGVRAVGIMDNMLSAAPDLATKLTTAIFILGKYMWLLVVPHPLVCDYSIREIPFMGFGDWQVLVSLLFYAGILGFAVWKMKEKGLVSFSIWFFLLTISLYCNLFVTIGTHMGERLLFVPSLGFCLFIAWALMKLFKKDTSAEGESLGLPVMIKANSAIAGIVGLVLVAYSYKTYSRNLEWESDYTLYSADVKKSSNSARTHYYYGLELMKTKALKSTSQEEKDHYLDMAIAEFTKATGIYTSYADAYDQIGLAYYRKNDFQKAVENYNLALKHNPTKAITYSNLGAIYFNSGQYEQALGVYDQAIKYNPRFADAYLNKGSALAMLNRPKEAIEAYKQGLIYEPNNAQIHKFLGITYQNMGDQSNASLHLNRSKQLDPNIQL